MRQEFSLRQGPSLKRFYLARQEKFLLKESFRMPAGISYRKVYSDFVIIINIIILTVAV
jgi:hypothetical protein